MAKKLQLTITKVDAPVFDGEVESVTLPGVAGELTLMADHEPLITPLKEGLVRVKVGQVEIQEFAIESGTLEVSHNHATVLI